MDISTRWRPHLKLDASNQGEQHKKDPLYEHSYLRARAWGRGNPKCPCFKHTICGALQTKAVTLWQGSGAQRINGLLKRLETIFIYGQAQCARRCLQTLFCELFAVDIPAWRSHGLPAVLTYWTISSNVHVARVVFVTFRDLVVSPQ